MKFVCMGFLDEALLAELPEEERATLVDRCFAYDDELRRGGHFLGGEALQDVRSAATLRWKDGEVEIRDGPFAETKEHLGGLLFLEARDLNHAITLTSRHPGVRVGPFEIRPVDDEMNARIAARDAAVRDGERT